MDDDKKQLELAFECKEKARTKRSDLNCFLEASKIFEKYGNLYISKSRDNKLSKLKQYKLKAYGNYILFESYDCKLSYYFEKHDIDKARSALEKSKIFISNAIKYKKLEIEISSDNKEIRMLRVWKFFKANRQLFECAINAREAWDRKDYILAIDNYNKQIAILRELLNRIERGELPQEYKRITEGNIFSLIANSSNAAAKLLESDMDIESGMISENAIIRIFQYVLKSYQAMNKAFEANPEQDNYKRDAENIKHYIFKLLSLNYDKWKRIYIHFWDNIQFRKLMLSLNPELYVRIEKEIFKPSRDKLSYVLIGSFALCIMIFIVLLRLQVPAYLIIVTEFCVIVLNIVLGSMILRANDRLSEKGMIEIIREVLSIQKDIMTQFIKQSNDV